MTMRSARSDRGRAARLLRLLAAGVVALLVGVVCGGLLFGSQPPSGPDNGTQPGPGGAAHQPAPAAGPPATGAPTTDTGAAAGLPADLRYIEVAGVPLPVSASAGPRDIGAGLARGFTETPAGAVLAAAHILARLHPQVGADVFAPTLATQVVGPDTEALAANVERGYGLLLESWPVAYGQPAGRLDFTIAGYLLDSYRDGEAYVRLLLAVEAERPLLGATGLTMRWQGGDWVLVAPPGGVFATTTLVDDPAGFTPWPAVGS